MTRTERCGNPTTLTPSTSAVEEVGMGPLEEKKRREARAWVLRAARWKEFMVVYLFVSLSESGTKSSKQTRLGFDGKGTYLYLHSVLFPT